MSSPRLRAGADAPLTRTDFTKEPAVSTVALIASSAVALGAGVLMAAAYYTEAHRAPDQS
jgi:hypothetical protein